MTPPKRPLKDWGRVGFRVRGGEGILRARMPGSDLNRARHNSRREATPEGFAKTDVAQSPQSTKPSS